MRTSTPILIKALEILSQDIESKDGVANTAILEAAQRMKAMHQALAYVGARYVSKGGKFGWTLEFDDVTEDGEELYTIHETPAEAVEAYLAEFVIL